MSFDPLSEQVMGIGIILTTIGFFLVFGVSAYHMLRHGQEARKAVIVSYDHRGNIVDPEDTEHVFDFFHTRNKFNGLLKYCHAGFVFLSREESEQERPETDFMEDVPRTFSDLRHALAYTALQFAILDGQAQEGNRSVEMERNKLEACLSLFQDMQAIEFDLTAEESAQEIVYDVDFELIDFGFRKPEVFAEYGLGNPARDYFAKNSASAEEL